MQTSELINEYFSLWNHHDARGIAELLKGNGCYFDQPKNVTYAGNDFVRHLQEVFTTTPLRYELVGEVLVGESSLAFRYKSLFCDGVDKEQTRALGAEFITLDSDNNLTQIDDFYQVYNGLAVEVVNKYKKSGLSREQSMAYKQQLDKLMRQESLYRDAGLKLPDVAQHMGVSVNHLSQVINSEFAMSFTDFLNHYRVADAKQMLQSTAYASTSIIDVGYEVGFNSNSTFYSAFKKDCQQTPAQFRQLNSKAGV